MVDYASEKAVAIVQTLSSIPAGKVSSYGEIAKRAGYPGLARYVAKLLSELPENSSIPWHRVVNSQGRISLPKSSPSYEIQKRRLCSEGVLFSNTDKISTQHIWV